MENAVFAVKGDVLTITVDLKHRGPLSESKKTVRVASTGGFQQVPGTDVKVNLNVTVKP